MGRKVGNLRQLDAGVVNEGAVGWQYMNDKRLVIEVGGRKAIPVRAIPYITGWCLSPDKVARQLSGEVETAINVLSGMTAYRLSAGIAIQVMPKEWDAILASIYLLDLPPKLGTKSCRVRLKGYGHEKTIYRRTNYWLH